MGTEVARVKAGCEIHKSKARKQRSLLQLKEELGSIRDPRQRCSFNAALRE